MPFRWNHFIICGRKIGDTWLTIPGTIRCRCHVVFLKCKTRRNVNSKQEVTACVYWNRYNMGMDTKQVQVIKASLCFRSVCSFLISFIDDTFVWTGGYEPFFFLCHIFHEELSRDHGTRGEGVICFSHLWSVVLATWVVTWRFSMVADFFPPVVLECTCCQRWKRADAEKMWDSFMANLVAVGDTTYAYFGKCFLTQKRKLPYV